MEWEYIIHIKWEFVREDGVLLPFITFNKDSIWPNVLKALAYYELIDDEVGVLKEVSKSSSFPGLEQ